MRRIRESFVFEFLIPAAQKAEAKRILKSAGYDVFESRSAQGIALEVTLDSAGEKRFLQKKLKDAGVYFEILQEESLESAKKKIKKYMASISKSKKAQAAWEEWEDKYGFNLSKADSYDIANAKAKLNKLIKTFNISEEVITKAPKIEETVAEDDEDDDYDLADFKKAALGDYKSLLDKGYDPLTAKELLADEYQDYIDADELYSILPNDLTEGVKEYNKLKKSLKESMSPYDEIMSIPDAEDRYYEIYQGLLDQSIDYNEFVKIMKGLSSKAFTFKNDIEGKPTPESEKARKIIKAEIGKDPGYFFFADPSAADYFNMEFLDEDSDAFWFTLTNSDDLDISTIEDLRNYIKNN